MVHGLLLAMFIDGRFAVSNTWILFILLEHSNSLPSLKANVFNVAAECPAISRELSLIQLCMLAYLTVCSPG